MPTNITSNPNGTLTIPFNGALAQFIPTNGLTGFNYKSNTGYGNLTILSNRHDLCSLTLCDLTLAHFTYIPSLGGNAFFAASFAVFILLNLLFGTRHKTWGYMVSITLGLIGEVVGYIGRILLHQNPFDPTGNNFLLYLVPLTISPAFLSAAIYLCLARIVVVYGEHLSRFRPRTYTLIFCGCDVFSLLLQAAGGGIASGANSASQTQLGINIMLAGLSAQVLSLALFAILCAEFAFRLYQQPESWNEQHAPLYRSKLFHAFLFGLSIATLTIFIRSAFRVAELSGGFRGPLANNQVSFMVLEASMIFIAAGCLTLLHPGLAFRGAWGKADFEFRGKKKSVEEVEMS